MEDNNKNLEEKLNHAEIWMKGHAISATICASALFLSLFAYSAYSFVKSEYGSFGNFYKSAIVENIQKAKEAPWNALYP